MKKLETYEPVNILVVDDRLDKLLAIETALSELNQNLVRATSGMEALRLLLKQDFAVILLDVSMPTMDGFETAALIRQRARSEHTPIIFVTSISTTETHVTRGYSLGAVDYIFSPVEPEILRAKVAVFIDLFMKTEQIRRQSELLRVAAEEKAANLELRLHHLLNRLDVGVFRASPDGHVFEANPAFYRLMDLPPGTTTSEVKLAELIPKSVIDAALKGKSPEGNDIRIAKADGSEGWILLSLSFVQDRDGKSVLEGLLEDITERKSREQKLTDMNSNLARGVAERTEALRVSQEHLRRSERLASLGTLAAGIAHEINNPLNGILMTARYAMRPRAKIAPHAAFAIICEEAVRGGQIVKGILKFAKEEVVNKSPTDINEVIRHSRDLVRAYPSTSRLNIELDLEDDLPQVNINSTAIEQVLVNLISNAADASAGEAQVTLRTKGKENFVRMEVADDGPGIPQETLTHIFDPFFSTKRNHGGTGLGLSICHGIVTEHGGTISVESNLGRGTIFSIELPVSSLTPEALEINTTPEVSR